LEVSAYKRLLESVFFRFPIKKTAFFLTTFAKTRRMFSFVFADDAAITLFFL